MSSGRFAPSPTSTLHVGNLRTALVSWLLARATGRSYVVRIEDLDVTRVAAAPEVARGQLEDLAALGLDWDGPVVRQSGRLDSYAAAAATLATYECYCTRREIAESASAPHDDGYRPYPGSCRDLSEPQRRARRLERPPALRVDARGASVTVVDRWVGEMTGLVDDFVIRRNDGAWAYNLAVVVDDLAQGVDQVCRGEDLLSSSPRQAWLASVLDPLVSTSQGSPLDQPGNVLDPSSTSHGSPLDQHGSAPIDQHFDYAHVGLVLNPQCQRLAKRDGAVSLAELAARGVDAQRVRSLLGASLGLCSPTEPVDLATLLDRFDPAVRPPTWTWDGA